MGLGSLVQASRGLRVKERLRLVATWLLLGCSRVTIAVLPFRLIRGFLGEHHASTTTGEVILAGRRRTQALNIAYVIGAAAAYCPWRADCYPQALTARMILTMAGIPHTVSFGVRRSEGELLAHAWVRAGDVVVTGGTSDEFTQVGAFTWTPRRVRA